MSIPRGYYDWKVEAFERGPEGHPRIRIPGFPTVVLSNGEEWVVTTGGEGCLLEVCYQRAVIAACEREIALARKTEDVHIWRKRLMDAEVEERKGVKERLEYMERSTNPVISEMSEVQVPVPLISPPENFGKKLKKAVWGF